MNTGIGDAINLAWKLKAVLDGRAPGTLLDSYEIERIAFARRLVQTTDRGFTFATAQGRLGDLIRVWVAPVVIPAAFRFAAARELAVRTVSQIGVNYRHSPLSEGNAGRVLAGDRLPWVVARGIDNHQALGTAWQAQVYGLASGELAAWCAESRLPLQVFPWAPQYGQAGLAQNGLYLLRPGTHFGLADSRGFGAPPRRD